MKFLIRNAVLEDSERLTELTSQLGYPSEMRQVQKRLAGILKNKDNCVFVALKDEKIVGWVHAFYFLRVESDPFVEIGGLVVDSVFRKKGIGKLLVDEIHKWAVSVKCDRVRVRCNTVRKETHVFYQKLGFEINKEQKVFDKRLKITPSLC